MQENGVLGWVTGGKPLKAGGSRLVDSFPAVIVAWIECALGLAEYFAALNVLPACTSHLFGALVGKLGHQGAKAAALHGALDRVAVAAVVVAGNARFFGLSTRDYLAGLGLGWRRVIVDSESGLPCNVSRKCSWGRVGFACGFQCAVLAAVLLAAEGPAPSVLGSTAAWLAATLSRLRDAAGARVTAFAGSGGAGGGGCTGLAGLLDAVLLVPCLEEAVYRAGLGRRLGNRLPSHPLAAAATGGVVFALAHAATAWGLATGRRPRGGGFGGGSLGARSPGSAPAAAVQVLTAGLAGGAWALALALRGSLLEVAACHVLHNAAAALASAGPASPAAEGGGGLGWADGRARLAASAAVAAFYCGCIVRDARELGRRRRGAPAPKEE